MRVPRIHTRQALAPGASVELEPEPSRHLSRVLRLGPGDRLVLFDGSGGEYPARITAVGRQTVSALLGEHRPVEVESPLAVHLGIAVSRGERMDWVVQKATELGVTRIAPLLTERTAARLPEERAQKKLEHWRRIAASACEQCGRNRLPRLDPVTALAEWLERTEADLRLVLHPQAGKAGPVPPAPRSVALLIGPEGGLSDAEVEAATARGYRALQLGPRVLRTETAPLAAITLLQARWGDMAGLREPA